MNKCPKCGANCVGEFCWKHKPKTLKKAIIGYSKSPKRNKFKEGLKLYLEKRNKFFEEIWKERKHVSEVSGTPLRGEIRSYYFHHILPKNSHPKAEFDKENIILLTLHEHEIVEKNMYFYEEVNKRREKLKIKYNL